MREPSDAADPNSVEGVPPEEPSGGKSTPRVLAATLPCENCGRPTVHRIVRWDPKSLPRGKRASGIARCRECGWTHRFDLAPTTETEVDQIVSRRSTSTRERVRLPAAARVAVGGLVPGSDPSLKIRRIDLRSGTSAQSALAREVATLWVTVDEGLRVAVSILEGPRTRATRWSVEPDVVVSVGDEVEVDGVPIRVVALRAAGHTWRRFGDHFRAGELERLYGRRTVSPPAGRSDWSRGRGRPSSRTSSFSRSSRSRSGPGERRTRIVPFDRSAAGGATVHKLSPR